MQTVYILSGPAGVGKSTTSNALVSAIKERPDEIARKPAGGTVPDFNGRIQTVRNKS